MALDAALKKSGTYSTDKAEDVLRGKDLRRAAVEVDGDFFNKHDVLVLFDNLGFWSHRKGQRMLASLALGETAGEEGRANSVEKVGELFNTSGR